LKLAVVAAGAGTGPAYWALPLWGLIIIGLFLAVFGTAIQKGRTERVPRGFLFRLAEHIYVFIENMCVNVIGPRGRKYVPFVGTMFIFIVCSNLWGLLGLPTPTASLAINLGLSITVFVYVQYEGIRNNGILGYIKHFWGPMALIGPLMLFVEVVSEFAKIISLSLRLYGNVHGEHEVSHVFGNLVSVGGFPLPLQAPILLLAIFTSLIQALVFAMLTTIYLALMSPHDHEEEHTHAATAAAH